MLNIKSYLAGAIAITGVSFTAIAPSALAQDHINITIIAPSYGAIPRLAAGSFEITNEAQLTQIHAGGQNAIKVGATDAPRVQMTLPWDGEVTQFIRALASSSETPDIDHITCDFVHAGSDQPYYTVIIDQPIIGRVQLVYDSATTTATEEIALAARQVEYPTVATAGSSTAAAPAQGSVRVVKLSQPVRLVGSMATLRSLRSLAASAAGPPIAAFANFAAGAGGPKFAAEQAFPAWTNGAMANLESLTLSITRQIIIHKFTSSDGTATAVPSAGAGVTVQATFTKGVGSLTNELQGALSSHQQVTTTLQLADAPARLGQTIVLQNANITSDRTALSNGRSAEQVAMTATRGTVTDLRRNATVTVQ
jgi:hypothetical protein